MKFYHLKKKLHICLVKPRSRFMEYDKNSEVYSKVVRAGKRTYFFDVKATKSNDLYLTLTESKKTIVDGRESYQKHKLFLYKEDFEKFQDGLTDVLEKIQAINSGEEKRSNDSSNETKDESTVDQFSEVSFDDL